MRNNNSSLGLETSQLGRKKPFLPKLLAGKPRLGTPGACGGVQGKRLRWECLRDPPPIPVFPEGCPAPGGHPRAVTEWDTGTFSPPKLLSALGAETSGIFGCWRGGSRMLPPSPNPSRTFLGQG